VKPCTEPGASISSTGAAPRRRGRRPCPARAAREQLELVQRFVPVRRNRPVHLLAAHRHRLVVQAVVGLVVPDLAERNQQQGRGAGFMGRSDCASRAGSMPENYPQPPAFVHRQPRAAPGIMARTDNNGRPAPRRQAMQRRDLSGRARCAGRPRAPAARSPGTLPGQRLHHLRLPAGGMGDYVARPLAEKLRGKYAANVLVEAKPGAGGRIAVEYVKRAAPDGLTILQIPSSPMALYPHTYKKLTYDPLADFIPVTSTVTYRSC
jgi:hypothetical protein